MSYHPFKKIIAGINYLVELNEPDELDGILIQYLGHPSQNNYLWGEKGEWLSDTGKKLGWVPNQLSCTFFNETVLEEIGLSFISAQNKLKSSGIELKKARAVLEQLKIAYLAEQNPFLLSAGESHLVWFLSQWAKQPLLLVSSFLPTNLSPTRLIRLLDFIVHSDELAYRLEINSPKFLLGFLPDQTDWFDCLFSTEMNWKNIKIKELIDRS